MKLTGELYNIRGLSEGNSGILKRTIFPKIFFRIMKLMKNLLAVLTKHSVQEIFKIGCTELGLKEGTVVSYRAGDQQIMLFHLCS